MLTCGRAKEVISAVVQFRLATTRHARSAARVRHSVCRASEKDDFFSSSVLIPLHQRQYCAVLGYCR